ncbi:protein-glutamate methylesterase/protein-glutamine glutaminase [Chitinimonas sp. BJB300]|uniref:protein-glutamate methylesterase/protein-glutamine glutaminase n=1 Tax=Chitinimonas sp. BJB300 TaxID=1559339 RepID=UPI000C0D0190|nr:chemotaxis response regulator protein-glutamate methylesterase [Chitinimonas sp. BJB300]PHV13055.1 chemotaxis response regulator protein-glutamate methylesterase [Chitinimonas sp. BJB300]TSJ87735.1 chemotaxis response regulator protein-glutamate methylesterase [Chitinimonas sp. BJB300]
MTINVLIVDDSAVVRQVLTEELRRDPEITVIGTAADPIFAREKMKTQWPDVIILDIEMPRMDGLTFLRQLMTERPTPVVICSTLTERGAKVTMEALSLGALGIITKPSIGVRNFLQDSSADLLVAVRSAYAAAGKLRHVRPISSDKSVSPFASGAPSITSVAPTRPPISGTPSFVAEKIQSPKLTADAILPPPLPGTVLAVTERIVVLGVSTGGVQALEQLLPSLTAGCPPLAIVQHMPEKFTATFAQRLNNLSKIEVKEAENNDRMMRGRALIAPGGKHLMVKRAPTHYYVEVIDGPLVSRHRPSVDVLFRSAAKCAGRNALGVIMTGMGDDGARGLKEMHDLGASTIAQDEASCIVFGMPKEAIRMGGVGSVASLDEIPGLIERSGNRLT